LGQFVVDVQLTTKPFDFRKIFLREQLSILPKMMHGTRLMTGIGVTTA
jgi:hypothetical protein